MSHLKLYRTKDGQMFYMRNFPGDWKIALKQIAGAIVVFIFIIILLYLPTH